jgi:S-adenosylmethionine:tRNA ribosyltransferase-isomerase
MWLEDFDYPLDASLIAQQPLELRDHARLLVVDRHTGDIQHHRIADLPNLLRPLDLLVLNDTQVFPARLFGTKRPSGGKIELLLVRPLTPTLSPGYPFLNGWMRGQGEGEIWEVLIRGKARPGQQLELPHGLVVTILEPREGSHMVSFPSGTDVLAYAEKAGEVPLPPYIRRDPTEQDRGSYQTIFARHIGAVAAPTAGLHFTPELLRQLTDARVCTAMVTLHVGPGTFKPVTTLDISDHHMEPEWCDLPAATTTAVQHTRQRGGRVIAVGSTSVRVLETRAAHGFTAGAGETSLFIYPGYQFQIVDGMLTNFHLPKSTLFMLVCAFAGRDRMLDAYRIAAAARYRFYSYGDAMLIL